MPNTKPITAEDLNFVKTHINEVVATFLEIEGMPEAIELVDVLSAAGMFEIELEKQLAAIVAARSA